jgi:hypothetical protein
VLESEANDRPGKKELNQKPAREWYAMQTLSVNVGKMVSGSISHGFLVCCEADSMAIMGSLQSEQDIVATEQEE